MNLLDGVIFDQDGLMFDTKRHAWQPAWRYALAVYHLPDKPGFGLGCRGLAGDGMLEHIHNYYGPDVDAEGIVRIANAKAAELSRRGVPKKKGLDHILAYLSEESQRQGSSSFTIPYNRQELADYLSVNRSALSTELGKLRDEGVIDFDRSRFTLLTEG